MTRWQPGYHGFQKWLTVPVDPARGGAARKKAVVAIARQLAVDLWRVFTCQKLRDKTTRDTNHQVSCLRIADNPTALCLGCRISNELRPHSHRLANRCSGLGLDADDDRGVCGEVAGGDFGGAAVGDAGGDLDFDGFAVVEGPDAGFGVGGAGFGRWCAAPAAAAAG